MAVAHDRFPLLTLDMLLSRKHNFIFIKTIKVAGTSVEYALSKLCKEPEDVVTPLGAQADIMRLAEGCVPRNYSDRETERDYLNALEAGDVLKAGDVRSRAISCMRFHNHISAQDVRTELGAKTWNAAFKFSIVRNPYDFAISALCHHMANLSLAITPWARRRHLLTIVRNMANINFELTSIDGRLALDPLLSYESIVEGLQKIAPRIGGDVSANLPRFKSQYRPPPNMGAATEFTYLEKQLIALAWRKEFQAFGYRR